MLKDRIIQIRENAGLNKANFAKKLNINPSHVTRIEKGENEPSKQLLELISLKFDVNLNWLLYGKGSVYSHEEYTKEQYKLLQETKDLNESQIIELLKIIKSIKKINNTDLFLNQ